MVFFPPVKVALSASPKIGGAGLEGKYKAVEFHFHWGDPREPQKIPGSEHSIDGEKYPMEVGGTVCGPRVSLQNSGILRSCSQKLLASSP